MPHGLASPDPGQDDDPAGRSGEPAESEDWIYPGDDPGDDVEDEPGYFPKPGVTGTTGPRAAGGGRTSKGTGRAAKGTVKVPKGGRRGPGQPGSARRVPGASPGPAGSFAAGPCSASP